MNGTLPNGYQHQQEYPNIQQTPPSGFETKPVNFNDSHDDFFQAGDDGRPKAQTQNDRSSVLTGWTSGITVPYSEHVDEKGQTQAQAIASEYSAQGSRLSNYPPVPEIPAHLQNLAPGDRKSTGFVRGSFEEFAILSPDADSHHFLYCLAQCHYRTRPDSLI
jgi:hypothetical protein